MPMITKTCSKCDRRLILVEFYPKRDGMHQRAAECMDCRDYYAEVRRGAPRHANNELLRNWRRA